MEVGVVGASELQREVPILVTYKDGTAMGK